MRFLALEFMMIVNQVFIGLLVGGCQALKLPCTHGKRELRFANYPPQNNPNPQQNNMNQQQQQQQQQQQYQQDYYNNYYQQRNTLDDAGYTRQNDDNEHTQQVQLSKNSSNIQNFLEFNNPPEQMFHLIYMPLKLNKGSMTQTLAVLNNKQQNRHAVRNLDYTGPQQFPVTQNPTPNQQYPSQSNQPQAQSQAQNILAEHSTPSPPPAPVSATANQYYNYHRFYPSASMGTSYQQIYNNNQFPASPLRAPPTQPYNIMTTKMEAPFIPSQFLGYAPSHMSATVTPPSSPPTLRSFLEPHQPQLNHINNQPMTHTLRPYLDTQSNLIKPVHENQPAELHSNPNNAENLVYMPGNNFYDMFRGLQRY